MTNKIDTEHWLEIRKRTPVVGVGSLQCGEWCDKVEKMAPEFSRRVVVVGDITMDRYFRSTLTHQWLEREQDREVLVADGTAGQFDPEYPDGYYGPLNEAPPKLREIYLKYKRP